MKLFYKLVLAALVIAFLLPFTLLRDEEGKTLMSFSSLKMPDFKAPDISLPDIKMPDFKMPDMSGSKQLIPSDDGQGRQDIVYRWNDSAGVIHFTTEPPAEGIPFTVKGYDPNTNVIQAVKLPEVETPAQPIAIDATDTGEQESSPDLDNPYNQKNIQKLFDDSRNMQQLFDKRFESQNSAINQ